MSHFLGDGIASAKQGLGHTVQHVQHLAGAYKIGAVCGNDMVMPLQARSDKSMVSSMCSTWQVGFQRELICIVLTLPALLATIPAMCADKAIVDNGYTPLMFEQVRLSRSGSTSIILDE